MLNSGARANGAAGTCSALFDWPALCWVPGPRYFVRWSSAPRVIPVRYDTFSQHLDRQAIQEGGLYATTLYIHRLISAGLDTMPATRWTTVRANFNILRESSARRHPHRPAALSSRIRILEYTRATLHTRSPVKREAILIPALDTLIRLMEASFI
jgi:hypothetical protein